MEQVTPILPDNLSSETVFQDDYIANKEFRNTTITGYYPYTEIINSKFTSCIFQDVTFQGLDIENTILNLSNLSNLFLGERSFHKILFENCTLVGINFTESYLENITFKNCNLSYSNFSKANLKNVYFENCNLKESSFNEAKWKNLKFNESDLTETEFYKTTMKDIDLSTCTIKNIKIEINNLKGLQVSYEQALGLSLLLGIKIKS